MKPFRLVVSLHSHALSLGLFALLGCGEEDPDPLATAGGFCEEWAKQACTERVVDRCAARSRQQCELAQTQACLARVPDELYHRGGAQRCLDYVASAYEGDSPALTAQELAVLTEWEFPCNRVLSGTGSVGDRCEHSKDCRTERGLECLIQPGKAVGECHEPEVVSGGDRCADTAKVCDEGYYCNGTHCVALQEHGDECSAELPCAPDLRCSTEGDDEGSCIRRLAAGEACVHHDDCDTGLCNRNSDEETGLCTRELVLDVRVDACDDFR